MRVREKIRPDRRWNTDDFISFHFHSTTESNRVEEILLAQLLRAEQGRRTTQEKDKRRENGRNRNKTHTTSDRQADRRRRREKKNRQRKRKRKRGGIV